MDLAAIREHVWAEIMAAAAIPGGAQLRRDRIEVLLALDQMEVDRILFTLADLLPEKFAAALELAVDCVPVAKPEDVPYPEMVKTPRGGGMVPRAVYEFGQAFPRTIEGGRDLAAELDAAGGRAAMAAAWGIPVRSITCRVRAILKAFPEDPALDPLAEYAVLWSMTL